MKINNKVLVLLLAVSIFFSVFGAFVSLQKISTIKPLPFLASNPTGFATNDTANVTLIIQKVASIRFVNSSCNWGTGAVGTSADDYCTLESNGSGWVNNTLGGCVGFNTVSACLILENNGSARVQVQLNFSHNATSLFGELSSPILWYNVSNNETGSCQLLTQDDWNETTLKYEPIVCTNFSSISSANTLRIDFKAGFDANIAQGLKEMNLTALATSIE